MVSRQVVVRPFENARFGSAHEFRTDALIPIIGVDGAVGEAVPAGVEFAIGIGDDLTIPFDDKMVFVGIDARRFDLALHDGDGQAGVVPDGTIRRADDIDNPLQVIVVVMTKLIANKHDPNSEPLNGKSVSFRVFNVNKRYLGFRLSAGNGAWIGEKRADGLRSRQQKDLVQNNMRKKSMDR